jgi:hypothetical protein
MTNPTIADYILREVTGASYPGLLPYRGPRSRRGRGYVTRTEAERRRFRVLAHYAAQGHSSHPDLRVEPRWHGEQS